MINPVIPLSVARIGIGAVSLASPDAGFGAFMLDPKRNPQHDFVTRMFGSREIALGAATLLSLRSGRKGWILAGVAIDAADAVAAQLAGQTGAVGADKSRALTAIAGGAAVAGVLGLLKR